MSMTVDGFLLGGASSRWPRPSHSSILGQVWPKEPVFHSILTSYPPMLYIAAVMLIYSWQKLGTTGGTPKRPFPLCTLFPSAESLADCARNTGLLMPRTVLPIVRDSLITSFCNFRAYIASRAVCMALRIVRARCELGSGYDTQKLRAY